MPSGTHRKAFTLVELLVVIAIIGILVSLLLPAVQQVREAARRTECLNNIRQLALASHSYEAAQRRLPSGWIEHFAAASPEPDYDNRYGWATLIMPFIEADNLYKTYEIRDEYWFNDIPSGETEVDDDASLVLQLYICPSDTMADINPNWPGQNLAKLNYGANSGVFLVDPVEVDYDGSTSAEGSGELSDGQGAFCCNSRVKFRDMARDGQSNTLLFGERGGIDSNADDPANAIERSIHANLLVRIGVPASSILSAVPFGSPEAGVGGDGSAQVSQGIFDPIKMEVDFGVVAGTIAYEDYRINANTDLDDDGINAYAIGYTSAHPGGANFAFADGSSRYIAEFIDDDVFLNLLQRNDGNVVDKTGL